MQRLSRSLRALPVMAPRTRIVPAVHTPAPLLRPMAAPYATKSSPKSAEKASAQSGGSRSKGAVEEGKVEGQHEQDSSSSNDTNPIDSLADNDARGRTGGGEPLDSSSDNAPPKPKISNASIPGKGPDNLTKEQQKEVDEHNREFEEKHDRAAAAEGDKVHKSFWSGGGTRDAPREEKEDEAAKKGKK